MSAGLIEAVEFDSFLKDNAERSFEKMLEQGREQAVVAGQVLAFVEAFNGGLFEGFVPRWRTVRIGQS